MAGRVLEDELQRGYMGDRRLVNASRTHRVVDVAESDDAGAQGNIRTCQFIWIAGAIVPFVVRTGDIDRHLQEDQSEIVLAGNYSQSFSADDRVRLHQHAFVGSELAWLEKNVIRQANFADVVQRGATFEHIDVIGVELFGEKRGVGSFACQTAAITLQARQVVAGFRIAILDQFGESQHQGIASLHQVAGTSCQVAFQLGIDGQQIAMESRCVILGFLQAQCRFDASLKLDGRERLDEIIVGAGQHELRHLVGSGAPENMIIFM